MKGDENMMKSIKLYRCIMISVLFVGGLIWHDRVYGRMVATPYGNFDVQEPVLLELFDSPALQRLKGVRQYGATYYADKKEYNRYEHSVGVWAILRRFNARLEEQIAGLLHDVSHTVFSHVGDVLFNHTSLKSSYQDDIHAWSLEQQKVPEILEKHGLHLESILHKSGDHCMLEQDLPDLNADRIEYNLYGGLLENMITKEDIKPILQAINYENGRWFFTDRARAKQFSRISLYHSEYIWGGLSNFITYRFAAQALRRAVEIGLISLEDVHFSVDDIIWEKFCKSDDGIIKQAVYGILHHGKNYELCSQKSSDIVITSKFRGVNPWVLHDGVFTRLTDGDPEFAHEYNRVKNTVTNARFVRLIPADLEKQ